MTNSEFYEKYIKNKSADEILKSLDMLRIDGFNAAREVHPHLMKFKYQFASDYLLKNKN